VTGRNVLKWDVPDFLEKVSTRRAFSGALDVAPGAVGLSARAEEEKGRAAWASVAGSRLDRIKAAIYHKEGSQLVIPG